MSIAIARERFSWPPAEQIIAPQGAGPSVLAALARRKIEQALRRCPDGRDVRVGVLHRDQAADATEDPVALVCEFPLRVSPETLREAHRLAWNFCRSKLLLIVEPHLVRAWTCCAPPEAAPGLGGHAAEIAVVPLEEEAGFVADEAARSLQWVNLVSGEFFQRHRRRFDDDGRADRTLLHNLRCVRDHLIVTLKLDADVAHDLLARIIFIQFLFDRKDSAGRPALDERQLKRLHEDGVLCQAYRSLGEILQNYDDAYRLFRWLNGKFNGDLFPGKGETETQREAEWLREMEQVNAEHLQLLSDFVDGRLELARGQYSLWRLYSFDAIPLEFISSIYEEFVRKDPGVHYTPGYLVDFILDGVLPWESSEWDVKILDPACGSGIFLVKAFQRLVYRWRRTHPGEEPRVELLRRLLERNLFGVDKDAHAVRVASFSLYLAMCDEIDPRYYWKQVVFPHLRGRKLVDADFFEEGREGFRTEEEARTYDVVIGNAPWGHQTVSPHAHCWANHPNHLWPVANGNVGPLFLAKAAALTKSDGRISMLQPASILFSRSPTAIQLRQQLFTTFGCDEVITLSALRFLLFYRKDRKDSKAKSPTCIVTLRPHAPDGTPLSYIAPKPHESSLDAQYIIIEPQDINDVYPDEAASDPWVWTALLWGGRRDLELLHRLTQYKSLGDVTPSTHHIRGIVRGDRTKQQVELLDRRILEEPDFPAGTFLVLDASRLPINKDPFTHSRNSRALNAFELPQLIVKRAWEARTGRFHAARVDSDDAHGVLCSQRYMSICLPQESKEYLEAACLSLNSSVAVYFLYLTGGNLASYIPEALNEEILRVPLPTPTPGMLDEIDNPKELDARVRNAFRLKEADWALIEDLNQQTITRVRAAGSTGRMDPTHKGKADLKLYASWFVRALREGTGANACATIFRETSSSSLPVHLVALHLDWAGQPSVREETMAPEVLWDRLAELNRKFIAARTRGAGGIFFQRVARIYDTIRHRGRSIPTVFMVKPVPARYWTRSMALRDADEVAADALGRLARGEFQPHG